MYDKSFKDLMHNISSVLLAKKRVSCFHSLITGIYIYIKIKKRSTCEEAAILCHHRSSESSENKDQYQCGLSQMESADE